MEGRRMGDGTDRPGGCEDRGRPCTDASRRRRFLRYWHDGAVRQRQSRTSRQELYTVSDWPPHHRYWGHWAYLALLCPAWTVLLRLGFGVGQVFCRSVGGGASDPRRLQD